MTRTIAQVGTGLLFALTNLCVYAVKLCLGDGGDWAPEIARQLIMRASSRMAVDERADFIDENFDLIDSYNDDNRRFTCLLIGLREWQRTAMKHVAATSELRHGINAGLAYAGAVAVIIGLLIGLEVELSTGLIVALTYGLSAGLIFGTIAAVSGRPSPGDRVSDPVAR